MVQAVCYTSDLRDKKRLRELIGMLKSRLQGAMMSSGHAVAMHRAMSNISRTEMITEKMTGIDFYRVIEEIENDFDKRSDELCDKLTKLSEMIFSKDNLALFDLIATKDQFDGFKKEVESFINDAPSNPLPKQNIAFAPAKISEAFKTSAKINYVAKAGTYKCKDLPYTGALKVLKVIMGYDYLWNQVRVVGGAYGCFGSFNRNGRASFASYRDPNLKRTLEVYDGAVSYLEDFDVNERDMTKYIIGTVSDLDFPLTPSAKGVRSKDAFLRNDTEKNVQKERDEVLACTKKVIKGLSRYVAQIKKDECICVIGGGSEIDKDKDLFDVTQPLFKM